MSAAAQWVDIDTLVPWPGNPRVNDEAVDALASTIDALGWGAVILARLDNNEVIAGHTRLKAAKKLGLKEVPVRYLDVDEVTAHAMALADNKLGEIASWSDGLADVLRELGDAGVDLDGLGWDLDELETLFPDPGAGDGDGEGPKPELLIVPGNADLHLGDCIAYMNSLPENSIDAIVCDPPYGLSPDGRARTWDDLAILRAKGLKIKGGFMGAEWDAGVPGVTWAKACLRVLKPGGHMVAFASTRTMHRLASAVEDAGFEIRDMLDWCYWSGFPKSLDVSKAIDSAAGAERKVVGHRKETGPDFSDPQFVEQGSMMKTSTVAPRVAIPITAPATPDAIKWDGWGTGIKPSKEPAVLARKPLSEKTVAANVLKWGTGALNIDACRFRPGDPMWPGPNEELADFDRGPAKPGANGTMGAFKGGGSFTAGDRFPANLLYCPKASRAEREAGCEALEPGGAKGVGALRDGDRSEGEIRNYHPTVKPIGIMRYLCRLVTPPGGVILDPFMGSGTTGCAAIPQGFDFKGAEMDKGHVAICEQRIAYWATAAWPPE